MFRGSMAVFSVSTRVQVCGSSGTGVAGQEDSGPLWLRVCFGKVKVKAEVERRGRRAEIKGDVGGRRQGRGGVGNDVKCERAKEGGRGG